MNWQAIIVLALIVEGIVTNLKFLWSKEEFSISRLVALIVSILIAILTNADLFSLVSLPVSIPFIGASALDALFGDSPVFYRTVTNRQNRELADRIALLAKQADKDAVEKVAALLRSEGQTLRTPSQQRAVNFALNRLAQSVSLR